MTSSPDRHDVPWPAVLRATLLAVLAWLALNTVLGVENLWPTLAVVPKAALSPEVLALVGVLAWWVGGGRAVGPRARRLIAGAVLLAIVGRYLQVTAPALFGRPLNLYWDGRHLPQVLTLAAADLAPLQALVIALGALSAIGLSAWLAIRFWAWVIGRLCDALVVKAVSRAATGLALGLLVVWGAGRLGGVQALERPFSQPVSLAYLEQGRFVARALLPGAAERLLPASPAFAGDVAGLGGADVLVLFLESYGAVTRDDPRLAAGLRTARERLAKAVGQTGIGAVSTFVRSPTFGGGSWLAHASLLSGLAMDDPARYHLLLTTDRPTLVRHFRAHGYEAVGWMPGLHNDWPEGTFYGYDRIVDAAGLDYRGPVFGFWRIPDQYSIARLGALELGEGPRRPRFVVFPTITSHVPFQPLPPYVDDGSRWLRGDPFEVFDADVLSRVLAEPPDWSKLTPAYTAGIDYSLRWLADFIADRFAGAAPAEARQAGAPPSRPPAGTDRRDPPHPLVIVALGDHQPAAAITGPAASWDVPVHVFARDPRLLDRLVAAGFARGLEAPRAPLGHMAELTAILSAAFEKPRVDVAGTPDPPGTLREPSADAVGANPFVQTEAQRLAR